jgi:hypothetical protein
MGMKTMAKPEEMHGKKLAVIAWAKKDNGEDDVTLFAGVIQWDGSRLVLNRGEEHPVFPIPDAWFGRLQMVDKKIKETLMDSDYSISVSVGKVKNEDVAKIIFKDRK